MTMDVKITRISQNIIKSIYAVYKENIEDTENLLDVYNDSKKKQLEVVLEGINQIAKLFPTEGKGKSGKSEGKSTEKVKRPLNPYVMFCNEKRSEVKEDNPDLAPKEITKVLGQMWQELDDEEKEKYRPADSVPAKKKSSPGRGISGWILFCSENRASTQKDNSDLPPKEITKVLGQMWRDLSNEERQEFNDKAKSKVDEMRKKYEVEKEEEVDEEEEEKPKKEKKSKSKSKVSESEDEEMEVEEEKPKKKEKKSKSKVSESEDEVEEEKPKKKEKKSKKSKVSESEDEEEKPKKEKKSKKSKSKVSESEDEEVEEEKPKKEKKSKKSSSDEDEDEIDRKVRSIFDDEEEVAAKPTKRSPSKVPKPKKN